MSNYIIFSSYYKHGETNTVVAKSFKECFGAVVESVYDFMQNQYELWDEYEEYKIEEDMEEHANRVWNEIKDYESCFNKYKVLFETERNASNKDKLFEIFTEKIEVTEEQFFADVIHMNKVIYDNDWSIRTIIKIPCDSYSCWVQN